MRCVVTGGAGFIGKHLVRALAAQGHIVSVIDKRYMPEHERTDGVYYYQNDIKRMASPIEAMTAGITDVVFHLAAVSRTVPAINDPVECINTNVYGTARVLEACRRNKVPRVVVASSNVVLAGCTAYRASKKAVEDLCEVYNALYGQSVIALRFSNVYGPGIPKGDGAVFSMLRDSFNEKGYAEVTGDGMQVRDFTHVTDVVQAMLAAWTFEPRYKGVVDICTGRQTSLNAACTMLKIPVKYIADRPGDVKSIVQNRAPAMHQLGWNPHILIEEGIVDIWQI
jgi:UDP-glucose 4-epimerase